jgi:hypothetical protein
MEIQPLAGGSGLRRHRPEVLEVRAQPVELLADVAGGSMRSGGKELTNPDATTEGRSHLPASMK